MQRSKPNDSIWNMSYENNPPPPQYPQPQMPPQQGYGTPMPAQFPQPQMPPQQGYGAPMPPQYPQPQMPPQGYGVPMPPANDGGGLGVASLIFGIIWLGGLGSLLAVIFGVSSRSKAKRAGRSSGLGTAGLILGILGILGSIVFYSLIVVAGVAVHDAVKHIGTVTTANVGQSINISDSTQGYNISIVASRVIDPASPGDQFSTPAAGTNLVGIEFKITNNGTTTIQPTPSVDATVIDSAGTSYNSSIGDTIQGCPAFASNLSLAPGSTIDGCVVFAVDANRKVSTIQYSPASAIFANSAQWNNP